MPTTMTVNDVPVAPANEPLPRIPGYAVERVLGRGGMGCVYLARDQQMGREVAIKTLFAGADAPLVARFREEVTAVAAVHHPNVLQVYHAGEADGRPYLVMEYVPGGSLAEALDGKPLAPREAAAFIEQVARAIQQCHEQGVLHRDLKPGNILLQRPEVRDQKSNTGDTQLDSPKPAANIGPLSPGLCCPKVADFGLAKRLQEGAGLTRTGEVLGTPAYMAPEQASGVVSTLGPGVDIYALGAILYEMLTGRPPFSSPDPMQTLMMVLSMDPIPPRLFQPKLPRDIDTICLKCLEKTPRKRYASAATLADDLQRFMDGRPITARPVRSWEKAAKWAKRRPAATALLLVSVLALAVIVGGGLVYNARLQRSNERLEGELSRSQAMFHRSHLLAKFLLDEHAGSLGSIKGSTASLKRLVEELLPYLDHLAKEIEGHDRIPGDITVPDLARAYEKIAGIQGYPGQVNLEDRDGARATFSKALALRRAYMASHPDDVEAKKSYAKCLFLVAEMEAMASDDEARPHFEQALAIVHQLPDDATSRIEREQIVHEIGMALADMKLSEGNLEDGFAAYRGLLTRARKVNSDHPNEWRGIWNLAQTLARIAEIQHHRNQLAPAAKDYEEALALSRMLAKARPEDIRFTHELAINAMGYGDVQDSRRDREKAIASYQESVKAFRELVTLDPNGTSMRREMAISLEKLGACLSITGRAKDGIPILEESVAILRDLVDQALRHRKSPAVFQRSLRFALTSLGRAYGFGGDREKERKCLIEALILAKEEKDIVGEAGIFLFLGESFLAVDKTTPKDKQRADLRSSLRCLNDSIALYEQAEKSGSLPGYLKHNLTVARKRRDAVQKQQDALGQEPEKKKP